MVGWSLIHSVVSNKILWCIFAHYRSSIIIFFFLSYRITLLLVGVALMNLSKCFTNHWILHIGDVLRQQLGLAGFL